MSSEQPEDEVKNSNEDGLTELESQVLKGAKGSAASSETTLVGVDPADMRTIITGLREMPGAVKQMAGAVEQLARNSYNTPTKTGTAIASLLSAVFVVAAVAVLVWRVENTVDEIQAQQLEGQAIVEATYDCLNYTEEGDPAGKCAQRTTNVITSFATQLTEEVRCQSEIGFFLFITQNPELGVQPNPLSEDCLASFEERMRD